MERNSAFIKAFPFTWGLTILVALILWLTAGRIWALSFVLGSVTTLMMMSVLYKSTMKALQPNAENVQKKVVLNYVFRYFFYAVILIAAALLENFEVIGVAIGLFTFKVSLYLALFLERRNEVKNHD